MGKTEALESPECVCVCVAERKYFRFFGGLKKKKGEKDDGEETDKQANTQREAVTRLGLLRDKSSER